MATTTLGDMRRMVRELACQETTSPSTAFVERNPELDGRINEWLCALRDLMIEVQGNEWAMRVYSRTLTADRDEYQLPADFDEMLGVRLQRGGDQAQLNTWDYADLARLESDTASVDIQLYRYRIRGQSIVIKPTPTAADTLYLDYIPAYEPLHYDAEAETFAMPYGAWRWAALGAAADLLRKEDATMAAQNLMAAQMQMETTLRGKAARRSRRAPRIHDTRRDLAAIRGRNRPYIVTS